MTHLDQSIMNPICRQVAGCKWHFSYSYGAQACHYDAVLPVV